MFKFSYSIHKPDQDKLEDTAHTVAGILDFLAVIPGGQLHNTSLTPLASEGYSALLTVLSDSLMHALECRQEERDAGQKKSPAVCTNSALDSLLTPPPRDLFAA